MKINNIKELKDFIKDMPDEMSVQSCCSSDSACSAKVLQEDLFDNNYDVIGEKDFLWIGYT